MSKNPERSDGARRERKAIRAYLRRMLKLAASTERQTGYRNVLDWVLARQKRYDKREGGL